jgi:anti-anti-sigma factor
MPEYYVPESSSSTERLSCIHDRTVDGVVTVFVGGDIDFATRRSFLDAIVAPSHHAARVVVVDLGAVTFMDSSGVHALLAAQRHLNYRRTSLRLGRLSESVRTILDLTGAIDAFCLNSGARTGGGRANAAAVFQTAREATERMECLADLSRQVRHEPSA